MTTNPLSVEQIETLRYALKLGRDRQRLDTIDALCDLARKWVEQEQMIAEYDAGNKAENDAYEAPTPVKAEAERATVTLCGELAEHTPEGKAALSALIDAATDRLRAAPPSEDRGAPVLQSSDRCDLENAYPPLPTGAASLLSSISEEEEVEGVVKTLIEFGNRYLKNLPPDLQPSDEDRASGEPLTVFHEAASLLTSISERFQTQVDAARSFELHLIESRKQLTEAKAELAQFKKAVISVSSWEDVVRIRAALGGE